MDVRQFAFLARQPSAALKRRDDLETAVEDVRRRFGSKALYAAALLGDLKMPADGREKVRMPGLMYK